jgi:hypothetical protein
LLVFDALTPYIEIFENSLLSFSELCQEQNLIIKDFNHASESEKGAADLEGLMKKIKICDGASSGREVVLNFFITQYNKHLLRKMTEKLLQPTELMQGTGMTV